MKISFVYQNEIHFKIGSRDYTGNLAVPKQAQLLVVFSHAFNSSRFSERNMKMAHFFNKNHIATLLVSLETVEEDLMMRGQSVITMADHLQSITQWVDKYPLTSELSIVYFGEGTGADTALCVASTDQTRVKAIICCAGRPNQAFETLDSVDLPVLLLVGSHDEEGIALNKLVLQHLQNGKLKIIPGASELFEERGKLRKAADATIKWLHKKNVSQKLFSPELVES